MKTDYQKQGEEFLSKHGVSMKVTYIDHKPYFQEDKESRDVYRVTFSRNGKRFGITFGQSIASAGQEPTAYDVLACIEKRDYADFKDFCESFGYDEDSRKSFKTFKACDRQAKKVMAFFSADELEELCEIN